MRSSVDAFERWRRAQPAGERVLLVVGGGAAADVAREFDAAFALGDERSHWLALRAMQLNAHCLRAAMPDAALVASPDDIPRAGATCILDPLAWLEREAEQGVHIPHRWSFTSDSVAAHVAARIASPRLVMLKSVLPPTVTSLSLAAGSGLVDSDFPAVAAGLRCVELVNLRSSPPESRVISTLPCASAPP